MCRVKPQDEMVAMSRPTLWESAFWECPPPMDFTHYNAWCEHYHELKCMQIMRYKRARFLHFRKNINNKHIFPFPKYLNQNTNVNFIQLTSF